jgi:diacylglycerol kinase (ATP)
VPDKPSPYKSQGGLKRLIAACQYSARGLTAAIKHEAAFRQELAAVLLLTPLAFWVGSTAVQIILLLSALAAVLVVELLNSAIEALADAVSLEKHPLLGRAKDLGSAAVFMTVSLAVMIWVTLIVIRLTN